MADKFGTEFWVKNDTKNINILLPVTPKSYDITYEMDIQTVEGTNVGDINTPTHRKLMSITIDGMFSLKYESGYVHAPRHPVEYAINYVDIFKQWIDHKDIVRLIIIDGIETKVNALFYVSTIKYSENNTSNGDIDYTLTFREYRPLKAVAKVNTSNSNSARTTQKAVAKNTVYTTQSGDYLKKIAKKFYGNSSKYTVIYNANKKIIGKDPNKIHPGMKLIIP